MSTLECYVSYYGDGAVYDCAKSYMNCRTDGEPNWGDTSPADYDSEDDYPEPSPSCVVLTTMPTEAYSRLRDYCRNGNSGSEPFDDGYEAASFVAEVATETEVVSCTCPWPPEECDRLGGCYLCGGDHRE